MEQNNQIICVLGSANVDSFVYVNHIPVPGETIQADKYMIANGGKGANQAAAAGKLYKKCIFTGQVGNDDEMENLKKELEESNVQLKWTVLPNVPTGKAFIYVDEKSGENSIVIVGGANTNYTSLLELSQAYKDSIDQCSLLQLQKEVPTEINVLAAKYAKSKGKIVMLDCGGRDDHIPGELLQNLDYISPNETELLRIDPDIDINDPATEIREKLLVKYPNLNVILKLGTKGSDIITNKLHIHTEVAPKINPELSKIFKIVDTVGAGDCFTSAFCVKILESDWKDESKWEENYRQALIFGNSAAYLCITKKGAMPSMPNRKEVDELIENFGLFSKK